MWDSLGSHNCNEYNLNPLARNNWRASLVPAAAVIPAPIAYIKVVAVKKLVVEPLTRAGGVRLTACTPSAVAFTTLPGGGCPRVLAGARVVLSKPGAPFTLRKLECSKQALLPEYISME